MEYYAMSDIGRLRNKNQDQAVVVANTKNQILAVVCDGMGGHKAGEIASRVVIEHVVSCFKVNPPFLNESEVTKWISETIEQADMIVKKMSKISEEHQGMGTTIVLGILIDNRVYVGHVGDSRAYVYCDDVLTQITKDHTLVNALIEQGVITKEEGVNHAQKNVLLQAVGANGDINPSLYHADLEKGSLLLCSDGLYNLISESDMQEILKKQENLKDIAQELINKANENGGQDNIAVAIVRIGGKKR